MHKQLLFTRLAVTSFDIYVCVYIFDAYLISYNKNCQSQITCNNEYYNLRYHYVFNISDITDFLTVNLPVSRTIYGLITYRHIKIIFSMISRIKYRIFLNKNN